MSATPPNITVATLATRNFTFVATGATPTDAKAAMAAAWDQHRSEYGHHRVAPFHEYADEVQFMTGPLGAGFRDQSLITPRGAR